ncbi:DUF1990 domain-containing protein [Microbacterium sp. Gd 4-13]|uniref:DUF1990 family protein n=1 Tax=Microbacterium sp. Gd 4-13 TaxID=2173179 RepID=UPI000D57D3E8|nr:DUF1990 family protein [Microbacterium sp. Gd 4-13]PVW06388.1 DUF1990 domain-containing protein [Microbacterium sp. Gd 4-13]
MTDPSATVWRTGDADFRRSEVSSAIGTGEDVWVRASADLLRWRVKTRSGFAVKGPTPVSVGDRPLIHARVLGVTVIEPVEVVEVVEEHNRVAFAYRTLPGHPVHGEEAFIVHRDDDDVVRITVRSLTAPSDVAGWRAVHPLLRLAQGVARRRYLRALS